MVMVHREELFTLRRLVITSGKAGFNSAGNLMIDVGSEDSLVGTAFHLFNYFMARIQVC